MGLENKEGSHLPDVQFSRAQQGPKTVLPFGFNIGALITETMLVFIQGLFLGDDLPHKFSYNDKDVEPERRIQIIDHLGFSQLDLGMDPIIVIKRGPVTALNRGGLGRFSEISMTGEKYKKLDLVSCGLNIRVYGDYSHVELYSSLIFNALTFLTEPLKKFTIYSVGSPTMSDLVAVRKDSKTASWVCTISAGIVKEVGVSVDRTHFPILRNMIFKSSQVFDPIYGERAIVIIS